MKAKTKISFFATYIMILAIAAFIGERRIKKEEIKEYTVDELKDAMHNIVIEKNDPELLEFYTKFEDRVSDEFWEENYKYLLESDVLDRLEDLTFDFINDPSEDEFIKNSEENVKGYYDVRDNTIIVIKDEHWYANACHEMMHFFGGYNIKKINNCNEALTELLARGYCNLDSSNDAVYAKYFNYTIPLIRILGEDKIEETYFNRDINGFFNEIDKYTNKKAQLIENYNYLCEHHDDIFFRHDDKDKVDKYSKALKEYWSILDEMYENKYYKSASKDNSLNYYKYCTAMPNVKYYGISNSYVYSCKYNPFKDDELTLWANGTRYDVDDDGITYLMKYDVDLNVVKKKEIK